jgi:hypothetical protein
MPFSKNTANGSFVVNGATGGGATGATVLNVQGTQGQLFSVVDGLTGSLMSVNDISGLPILEVFSNDTVIMGTYAAPGVYVSGSNVGIGGTAATGYVLDVWGASRIKSNLTVTGSVTASVPTANTYVCQGKLLSDQVTVSGADTIIQFSDDFDPNNWWDAGTYRFTPTVSGYYSISGGAWLENPGTTAGQGNLQARKNGSTFAIVQLPLNSTTGISFTFNKIVYFNGSTDFMDLTFYQNSGTNKNILYGTASGSGTWFSAFLITM